MKKSLKIKFIIAFSITIVVTLVIFVSSMYTYQVLIRDFEDYSKSITELNKFRYEFDEFNESIESYLKTGSSDDLQDCQNLSMELNELCSNITNKYISSDINMQVSLVNAISSYYDNYIEQVQLLIDMENRTEAMGLYLNKYSKNGNAITEYVEKLISYNYKINSTSLENTHNKVQIFKIISNISFVVLILIIIVIIRMTFKGIIEPVQKLARQSQQIANYNFDVEDINIKTKDEIADLVKMFNHMREKLKLMFDSNIKNLQMAEELLVQMQGDANLEKFVQYQKDINEEMFKEANIDHLTNLMNQNAFIHCVNENIKSISSDELCALFVVDIDNFTSINTTLGDGSDEVLKYTAGEMNRIFKDCGFIARWNRDVFVGFISGLPDEEFAHQKCKEINSAMSIHFRYRKKYHPVTTSIGVSLCNNPVSAEIMFEHAEIELKAVKLAGKNGYHIARLK